ncbi:hypothetical protein [Phreatobacter sp.]|uniref:hypothetical protein n=1 Tax=Phreatobacter sp. TaxID=1966341 RepID=UPI003F72EB1F
MSGSTLSVCVQYVQAFSGPIIAAMVALGAGIVAFAQMRIAREKLRLDITKERYEAYKRFRDLMDASNSDAFAQKFAEFKAWSPLNKLLFSKSTAIKMNIIAFIAEGFHKRLDDITKGNHNFTADGADNEIIALLDDFHARITSHTEYIESEIRKIMIPVDVPPNTGADIGYLILFIFGMIVIPAGTAFVSRCIG